MAVLTKANKEYFIEQVIRNTPALDSSKYIDFFNVTDLCPFSSITGYVNLAVRYSNLIIPLMLPHPLLVEIFDKNYKNTISRAKCRNSKSFSS